MRLSVSKTLQSLDIPPSFLELKEELIYNFAWDTHSHLDSSKENKKWEKYWVQKKGDQCLVMGVLKDFVIYTHLSSSWFFSFIVHLPLELKKVM